VRLNDLMSQEEMVELQKWNEELDIHINPKSRKQKESECDNKTVGNKCS